MAQSLYRKYRPQVFEDVVGQEHVERTLVNAVAEGTVSHAYLFCGPRGTGKTTTARLLAKALLCEKGPGKGPDGTCEQCVAIAEGTHPDVYELDAASRTGVDNVRDEIIGRVQFSPTRGRYKVYIIDEVHMLSTAAFNALLKTLEEPPDHVIFILCTTDPQKVPATILSRCQRFDFHRFTIDELVGRLSYICEQEGIAAEPEALQIIARHVQGGMRDAIGALEQLAAFTGKNITRADAESLLGEVDATQLFDIGDLIARRDVAGCLSWIARFTENGTDMMEFAHDLARHLRNLYVAAVTGGGEGIIEGDAETVKRFAEQAASFGGTDRLARDLTVMDDLLGKLRQATDPRLDVEIAITRMARPEADLTLEALAERIEVLEGRVAQLERGGVGAAAAASVAADGGVAAAPAAGAASAGGNAAFRQPEGARTSRGAEALGARGNDASRDVPRERGAVAQQRPGLETPSYAQQRPAIAAQRRPAGSGLAGGGAAASAPAAPVAAAGASATSTEAVAAGASATSAAPFGGSGKDALRQGVPRGEGAAEQSQPNPAAQRPQPAAPAWSEARELQGVLQSQPLSQQQPAKPAAGPAAVPQDRTVPNAQPQERPQEVPQPQPQQASRQPQQPAAPARPSGATSVPPASGQPQPAGQRLTRETATRLWVTTVRAIRGKRGAIGNTFAGTVVDVDADGTLAIQFPSQGQFAIRLAQRPENRSVVEESIRETFGWAVPYRFVLADGLGAPAAGGFASASAPAAGHAAAAQRPPAGGAVPAASAPASAPTPRASQAPARPTASSMQSAPAGSRFSRPPVPEPRQSRPQPHSQAQLQPQPQPQAQAQAQAQTQAQAQPQPRPQPQAQAQAQAQLQPQPQAQTQAQTQPQPQAQAQAQAQLQPQPQAQAQAQLHPQPQPQAAPAPTPGYDEVPLDAYDGYADESDDVPPIDPSYMLDPNYVPDEPPARAPQKRAAAHASESGESGKHEDAGKAPDAPAAPEGLDSGIASMLNGAFGGGINFESVDDD